MLTMRGTKEYCAGRSSALNADVKWTRRVGWKNQLRHSLLFKMFALA
jgi:hypothetical protein